MATEGVFPKIDGDILYGSEANLLRPVMQVYTGTGFNSTATNTTTEASFELTAVTATQCKSAGYVKVKITGSSIISTGSNPDYGRIRLKSQIKETGGAYGDIVAYKVTARSETNGASGLHDSTYTYELFATITAGMKTNGFQIKAFSESSSTNAANTATFTNIQTVVELA